jgi:hypothetical protein
MMRFGRACSTHRIKGGGGEEEDKEEEKEECIQRFCWEY